MNNDKKFDNSSSDVDTDSLLSSTMNDAETVSTTTQYNCLETVEETEALATDRITEGIDIRISPRNSTVELINFQSVEEFSSEFSLVADVEVKMDDAPNEDRVISTFETTIDNHVQTNGDVTETLIDLDEDFTNNVHEKTANENYNQNASKLLNCDLSGKDLIQSNNKMSQPVDGPKRSDVARREPKNTGPVSAFTVESKIAQEIKEMKQREEDLRKMREMLTKEMSTKIENTHTAVPVVNVPPVTKKETVKQVKEIVKTEKEKAPNAKTPIVNGGQSYNIASVFGHKRKDASKSNENTPKADKISSATSTYESPIEKEIRIVKQREEELKREREQALKIKMQLESCQLVDLSDDDKETIDTFASVSICSDSSFDSGTKLTTPEQNPFDGSLSPTSMNNKINEMYCNSSIAESICSLDSISQSERGVNVNGLQKMFSHNSLKNSSFYNNSMRSPSPDSTSSSSISKMSFLKPSSVVQSKNVNMERFIASKGKQIVFKNTSPLNAVGNNDYMEIKPPQIKKSDQKSKQKFVSAASKIQTELQEMKEREEELKKERARLLGLNGQLTDLTPETKDMNHNTNSSTDICSSPDFLENEKEIPNEIEKEEVMLNQTTNRRRSTLIEEWERRIQNSGVQV